MTNSLLREIWRSLRTRLEPAWHGRPESLDRSVLCQSSPVLTSEVYQGLEDSTDKLRRAFRIPNGVLCCYGKRSLRPVGLSEQNVDFSCRLIPQGLLEDSDVYDLSPSTYRLLLAAESEWGKYRNRKENLRLVLQDFCKLVDIRACIKVMVYGCHVKTHPFDSTRIVERFQSILGPGGGYHSDEKWLFVGIPWDPGRWNPQLHLVAIRGSFVRLKTPAWI